MKQALASSRLLLPVMGLVMALLLCAGGLYQRMTAVAQVQQQQQQVQAELAAVKQQIAQSAQDRQWIARYSAEYRQLQRDGFIGEDQRLAWSQVLISDSARLGLSDVSFDIAPQQPHQPVLMMGNSQLQDTVVQFRANVPHEGVLAQLLDALRKQSDGIFTVRECALSRTAALQPLQVECVFVWHTLAPGAAT